MISKLGIDWEAILRDLADAEIVDDGFGDAHREIYLGDIRSLTPSGKVYTPWATGNLDPCPECGGRGSWRLPRRIYRLFKKRMNAILRARARGKDPYGSLTHEAERSLTGRAARTLRYAERVRAIIVRRHPQHELAMAVSCDRCDGMGCAEAADDARWWEELEAEASEHDCYVGGSDGDGCDIMVGRAVEMMTGEELYDQAETQE